MKDAAMSASFSDVGCDQWLPTIDLCIVLGVALLLVLSLPLVGKWRGSFGNKRPTNFVTATVPL